MSNKKVPREKGDLHKLVLGFSALFFLTCSTLLFVARNAFYSSSLTPLRWFLSSALPVFVAQQGLNKKSLDVTGALMGLLVGFVLSLAHWAFFASLLTFFVTSSKATKFRSDIKREIEGDSFKEGGQRNWAQVLCNGGMAAELAIFYLIDIGSNDFPIDFKNYYRASWIGIAVLGAISCCNGDTWASEFGTVLSSGQPYLITTFQRVPRGTNGGVSVVGFLASTLGGLVVGLAYFLGVYFSTSANIWQEAPSQIHVIWLGATGGFLGSLIDSLLGATVQFTGIDQSGQIVEVPGPKVTRISGRKVFDNHSINLLSSILTALILPKIALLALV